LATLGYSRRLHVRAYGHERQEGWFDGMERAFRAFGGVPEEVLLDAVLHLDPGVCSASPAARLYPPHKPSWSRFAGWACFTGGGVSGPRMSG
jgi:transposase